MTSSTGAPSTGQEPTSGETPTTGSQSGGGSTTGETTGEPTDTGEPVGPCADYCAKLESCGVESATHCPMSCPANLARHGFTGEACTALFGELLACQTAASCDALQNDPGLCEDEYFALVDDACTSELCDSYGARLVECNFAEEEWKVSRAYECTMAQVEAHLEGGDACGEAWDASMACGIALTCEQLDSAEGCEAERAAEDAACG